MCGILGIVSEKKFKLKSEFLSRLMRLEYRGYDSVGFATESGIVRKHVGSISSFLDSLEESDIEHSAIAHTRWATHGGITLENAHPHFDAGKNVFIVHNGIIENFSELRNALVSKGVVFKSETDTEVVAHLLDQLLGTHKGSLQERMKASIIDLFSILKGTYAIIVQAKDFPGLFVVKKDSPVVLGLASDRTIVSSDIFAFSDITDKAVFLEDFQFAEIFPGALSVFDKSGRKIEINLKKFAWQDYSSDSKKFKHHMVKEIYEQPEAASRLFASLESVQSGVVSAFVDCIKKSGRVIFLGSGTSHHAGMFGSYLLNSLGLDSYSYASSDFSHDLVRSGDVLIAVSQSGETMDLIVTLKGILSRPDKSKISILSLVNVPHSSIQRLSNHCINICAGQEICVAATKSFSNQVLALMFIAARLGLDFDHSSVPDLIEQTIVSAEPLAKSSARALAKNQHIYVIGQGLMYAVALESALKLKEITYIHAEGMFSGELKHGTLALIEKGVPVVGLVPDAKSHTISNLKEVEARGASVYVVSPIDNLSFDSAVSFRIPSSFLCVQALLSVIVAQLITYHTALVLKREIDKPRNLAKSVTVL